MMQFETEQEMADYLQTQGWGCESPATFRIDMEDNFRKIWEMAAPYTMISMERGYAVYKGIQHILEQDIPGDFVECGVWQGGCCMLMALSILESGHKARPIWLYDTFSGMTKPTDEDKIASSGQSVSERWHENWWAAGMDLVRRNLSQTEYPEELFHFVPGDICETLDDNQPECISLLRLDTDWYASTKKELECLYPKLEQGGILIIDDYGHFSGARQAVDEYFKQKIQKPLFHRSDYTGRIALKA